MLNLLKSYTFWIIFLMVMGWHDYKSLKILDWYKETYSVKLIEQKDAQTLLASIPPGVKNICDDGFYSYSDGSGTCSWHGGVDRNVEGMKYYAQRDFTGNLVVEQNRREKWLNIFCGILMIFALLLGRSIDGIFKSNSK